MSDRDCCGRLCEYHLSTTAFKKVLDLKDSGVIVYLYTHDFPQDKPSLLKDNNQHLILFNNNNTLLTSPFSRNELSSYQPKCVQCKCLVKRLQSLLNDLITIEGNQAYRVCQHCMNTKNSTCQRCNAIIKMFLEERKTKIEEYKKRYDQWLLKMKQLLHEILEREDLYPYDLSQNEDLETILRELQSAVTWYGLNIEYQGTEKFNENVEANKKLLEQILNKERGPWCRGTCSRSFKFSRIAVLKQKSQILKNEITDLIQEATPLLQPDTTAEIREDTRRTEENKDKIWNEAELKEQERMEKQKEKENKLGEGNIIGKGIKIRKEHDTEKEIKKTKKIEKRTTKGKDKDTEKEMRKTKKIDKGSKIRKEYDTEKEIKRTKKTEKGKKEGKESDTEKEMRKTRKLEKEPKATSGRKEKTVNKQEKQKSQKKKGTEKLKILKPDKIHNDLFKKLFQSIEFNEFMSQMDMKESSEDMDITWLFYKPELIIQGENLVHVSKIKPEKKPEYLVRNYVFDNIEKDVDEYTVDTVAGSTITKTSRTTGDDSQNTEKNIKSRQNWIIQYRLSDPEFIKKKWTVLPTFKKMQKINIYRTIPIPNWFTLHQIQPNILYDTGETLATMNSKFNGNLFYRSGSVALYYRKSCVKGEFIDIYEVFSCNPDFVKKSMEPKKSQKTLAVFDSTGNGVVYDNNGKVRLKYDQFEGWVVDPKIAPPNHWKWNKLNERPEFEIICHSPSLKQTIWDIETIERDPSGYKVPPSSKQSEENLLQDKPWHGPKSNICFEIKMKALKINEYFSLKILSQFEIYLFYRNGRNSLKMNLGVYLDSNVILRTASVDYFYHGSPGASDDEYGCPPLQESP